MLYDELIIIDEVLESRKKWKALYKECNNYFKENIGEPGCFDKQVTFKFRKTEMYKHKMYINHFLTHLILWQPFIKFKTKIDNSFIVGDISNLTNNSLRDFYNSKIINNFIKEESSAQLNLEISKVQEKLKKISEDYSMIMAVSTSVKDVIDLMQRYPEIRELLYYTPPKHAQPKEIEDDYNKKGRKLIKLLKTVDSPFKTLLNAGEGIKTKQFIQYLLCIGFQSDIDGSTYPIPIQSSFFNKGLQSASEYLLDATSGRKALIFNKEYTGKSGYFSRRLSQLAMDTMLHEDPTYDCGTKHYIPYKVKSKEHLLLINEMMYKKKKNSMMSKTINFKKDKDLIGETIYLRSPLTCAGEKVCHRCYGGLSHINNDINIGIYGAEEISSRIMQGILSSKHLLTTNSSLVELAGEYGKFVSIDANTIIFDPDDVYVNSKNRKVSYYLVIYEEDVVISDEDDEYDNKEFTKTTSKFYIKNNKGDIIEEIYDKNGAEFFIPNHVEQSAITKSIEIEDDEEEDERIEYWIPLLGLNPGEPVFFIDIQNNELTKPLKDIISLLDNKNHLGCETLEDLIEKTAELMVSSGMVFGSAMVHFTTAIRDIIRRPDKLTKRPNFKNEDIEYQILTIKTALYNNPSILVSLSFEQVGRQLKKPETFKKNGKSILDPLFFEKAKY